MQRFIDNWVGKQILFIYKTESSIENEQITAACNNMDRSNKHNLDTTENIPIYPIYID